jgi:PAS domain S-box-containing protein
MSQPPELPPLDRRQARRRTADLSLISSNAFLEAILNTWSALILILDTAGHILVFNRAAERVTGYTADEATGKFFWEISDDPGQAKYVKCFFGKLLAGPFPETHDRSWRTASGETRQIRWSLTATGAGPDEFLVAIGFDITEIRRAEEQLELRTVQLGERVKELACLYGITRLSDKPGLSLEDFLQGVARLIPPAWQFPEFACAEIKIEGQCYHSARFNESVVCQGCPVLNDGEELGSVRVCYRPGFPGDQEQPFLVEEARLLENIAEALKRVVLNYRARARISEYQSRLRSLASELALTGERERRRIAQELHNEIGHNLALLKFKLGEQRGLLPDHDLEQLLSVLETTIQATRTLTFELSPPVLHELGLGAALEWLAHQLEANYGIACRFHDDRRPKPLSDDLRVELFQAVRELLTNTGKHSRAASASLRAWVDGGQLYIEVTDDGTGFDPEKQRRESAGLGWGLFGIRERLAHLGAHMELDTAPGRGTRVVLSAPLGETLPATANETVASPASTAATPARTIRILLADDQQLTRAGLRSLLEREQDLQVVAEAGNGRQAVELARECQPDVVVMDVAMPELNGIEATRQIIAASPEIKVIGLSMHSDRQYVLEMLRAGATGYLLKDCAQEDLAQAVRIVQANLTFLSPGLAGAVVRDFVEPAAAGDGPTGAPELTPREVEVLTLLAQGQATKEIAHTLGVSVKTVETHRQHIMEKLGETSVAALTRFAIQRGLIELER